MIIVLLGASGSGKTTIEKMLSETYGFEKIISYTTRPKRENEIDGVDYHFTDSKTFENMKELNLFAEYDEYSQNRMYGTALYDYNKGKDKVVVLTPNGLRQLKRNCKNSNIFAILVNANLGTRIKRYIDRIGEDKFTFDDKNEIASRVERDYAMFLGLEREVDYVVCNNNDNDVESVVKEIINKIKG